MPRPPIPPPRNILRSRNANLAVDAIADGQVLKCTSQRLVAEADPTTAIDDHIADPTAAHAYTAISGLGTMATQEASAVEITGGAASLTDHVTLATVGKTVRIKTGAGGRAGNATLVGGTVTVSVPSIVSGSFVLLTRKTAGGSIGDLTYTIIAATSFTITSASGTDTSEVTYLVIDPAP